MSGSSTQGSAPANNQTTDNATASTLRVVSTNSAEHYVWGNQCDGWHLLRTPTLSVISERMPPGTAEVAHRHAKSQQFFFVLQGELILESGGVRHLLRARECMHMPPHVPHQALNVSNADVEFVVISEPPSHGDRIVEPL